MKRMLTIVTTLLLFLGTSLMTAQQQAGGKDQIVGAWTLVSEDVTNTDGSHTAPFGTNPKGIVIFDGNGHYALQLVRPDLPKFASNNRTTGTPEENRAVVQGTLSHFGKYSVSGGNIVFHIENSSFPNWSGDHQERPFTVSGDELTWRTLPASGGGKAVLVWKRAK
jgi:hypothetical protein